jgi:ATP-dependent DNA helicase RecQ
LEDMASKYPITLPEFENLVGVGMGKARKFAQPFLELIQAYCIEHEIERPPNEVVKTAGKNSADKLFIIQQIDRKTPLDEIASLRGIPYDDLLGKLSQIIFSGSRLNIDYFIDQVVDPDKHDAIYDYFLQAESDALEAAHRSLGNAYTAEEVQLVRAKFYAEVAN